MVFSFLPPNAELGLCEGNHASVYDLKEWDSDLHTSR